VTKGVSFLNEEFFEQYDYRIRELAQKFAGYTIAIDHISIRNWLRQFDEEDRILGLKLLDYVNYYDPARMLREARVLHQQIQSLLGEFDLADSYFAGFSFAGHSSGIVLERYRLANRFSRPRHNGHFIYLSELNRLFDKKDAKFFFIEDFAGTGNTTIEIWEKIRDFVPNHENVYLLLYVAHEEGKRKIEQETPLQVISNKINYEADKVLSAQNTFFTNEEKEKLRNYCEKAGSEPEGYGTCQSNTIFFYRAPNNCISILRCNNRNWRGLFIRNP